MKQASKTLCKTIIAKGKSTELDSSETNRRKFISALEANGKGTRG